MNKTRILKYCPATAYKLDEIEKSAYFIRLDKTLTLKNLSDEEIKTIQQLKNGLDPTSIKGVLDSRSIVSTLFSEKFISTSIQPEYKSNDVLYDQKIYYSCFSNNYNKVCKSISQSNIIVVGLGGLGTEILRHCISSGVGSILCIDHDNIESSNLNRQYLFSRNDIGLSKVDVIKSKLESNNIDSEIYTSKTFIKEEVDIYKSLEEHFPAFDNTSLIICAADEPPGKIESICINFAINENIPCLLTSMHIGRGTFSLVTNTSSLKVAKNFYKRVQETASDQSIGTIKGSSSWENSIVGSICSGFAIKHLAGIEEAKFCNKLLSIDCIKIQLDELLSF